MAAAGPQGAVQGLMEPGNIDLAARPQVKLPDGSTATVMSMSFSDAPGRETLVPMVSDDGKVLSEDQAIQLYRDTGRHLGKFDTPENATRYAQQLHTAQERFYGLNLPPSDDLGSDYRAERETAARREADPNARLDRLLGAGAAGDAAAAAPGAPGSSGSDAGQGNAALAASVPAVRPSQSQNTEAWIDSFGAGPGPRPQEYTDPAAFAARMRRRLAGEGAARGDAVGEPGALGRVAADVGKGAIEAPGAVYRGATGAVAEVFRTGDALATWLNDHVVDLTVPVPAWVPDWAQNPAKAAADAASWAQSAFGERQSVTGKAIEFTSQWLTSQAMLGPVSRALGLPEAAYTNIIKAAVGGAIAFDPKQPRLSNVIDEMAPNDFTGWLKASGDDPELLGRLKAGLENAGLQAVAEGVTAAWKFLKTANQAKAGAEAAPTAAGAAAAEAEAPAAAVGETASAITLKSEALGAVDNAAAKTDAIAPKLAQYGEEAAKFLKGEIPDVPFRINVDRIQGPDPVRALMGDMSKFVTPEVIPQATTIQMAKDLGFEAADLIAGNVQGSLFDKAQIARAWMVSRSLADAVPALAEKAIATGAPEDVARFNAAFALNRAVLEEVHGQTAEIGRALNILNVMRARQPDMGRALSKLMEESGGAEPALDLAARVLALKNDPQAVRDFLRQAGSATTRDQIVYAWTNILMSSPTTQVRNVGDTYAATVLQVPETWFASKLGTDVAEGEATARLFGIVRAHADAARAAWRAWSTGQSEFGARSVTEAAGGATPTASAELAQGGTLRQAADYLKGLMPTRVAMAGDEFNKVLNYRGEIASQAWRQAVLKEGLEGSEAAARAAALMAAPPQWMKTAGETAAITGTFNAPLPAKGVGASLMKSVDAINLNVPIQIKDGAVVDALQVPVGRVFVAFVRTPANILKWTFQRTPFAFLSQGVQADLIAGGAARDMALGRIAAGSAIMAAMADWTLDGTITGAGPKDPRMRENLKLRPQGWQPYSVNVGGTWYSFAGSGAIGGLVGIAADAVELVTGVYSRDSKTVEIDGSPVEHSVLAAAVLPFAGALLNRTYMHALAQLNDAISDPQGKGESWGKNFPASFIPPVVGAAERTLDADLRRSSDFIEAIKAKIPGLSDELPPQLDRWGRVQQDENGIWNLLSPTRVATAKGGPIDGEIYRLQLGITAPGQVQQFGQGGISLPIKLDPVTHNQLIALAGNELKLDANDGLGKLGAYDRLNAIAEGQGRLGARYATASDEFRGVIIKDVLQSYRTSAKAQVLAENDDLRQLVTSQLKARAQDMKAPAAAPASATPTFPDRRGPARGSDQPQVR